MSRLGMPRLVAAGFTLIEVLVAITLLAVLAVMAWRGLDMVISQRNRIETATSEAERVLRTLAQVERDLAQRVPDRLFAGRYREGGTLPLAMTVASAGDGLDILSVVRRQDRQNARGVTYALEDGRLMRRLGELTGQPDVDPIVMLEGVRRFDVRLLMGGDWVAPQEIPARAASGAGTALQITIERDTGMRYVQVVAL
jgi:general secretion pathway protein J